MKKIYLSTKHLIVTIMAASASLLSAQTFASGYGLHEVSASLMGNAYAGMASADEDISNMRFNPAILGMIDDHSFYLNGTGIFPEIDASHVMGNVSGTFYPFIPVSYNFSEGPTKASDIGNDAFVPAGFAAWHVNEVLDFGLAVTAPWGLSTSYNRDWTGRYFAIRSDLKSVNINPIASITLDDQFTIAVGFQAQYLNAHLSQKLPVPFLAEINPEVIEVIGTSDVYSRLRGDGWGYGWSLGALYELNEDTRIGVGWQSRINTTIEGYAIANVETNPENPFAGPTAETLAGDANTTITTPDVVNLGISHDIDPYWTIMGNVEWTHWSVFRDLHVQIDSANGETDTVVYENWENTWFYSIGADFRPAEDWVLRFGVGYDQSPVDGEHRNPAIPDSDRNIYSVGAGYNVTDDLRIDFAYMYLRFHDAGVHQNDLQTGFPEETKSLDAEYSGHANLVALGLEYVF